MAIFLRVYNYIIPDYVVYRRYSTVATILGRRIPFRLPLQMPNPPFSLLERWLVAPGACNVSFSTGLRQQANCRANEGVHTNRRGTEGTDLVYPLSFTKHCFNTILLKYCVLVVNRK